MLVVCTMNSKTCTHGIYCGYWQTALKLVAFETCVRAPLKRRSGGDVIVTTHVRYAVHTYKTWPKCIRLFSYHPFIDFLI